MATVDLDAGQDLEFKFKGKAYRSELPSTRKWRDEIAPLLEKASQLDGEGVKASEQLEGYVSLIAAICPAFDKETLYEMTIVQLHRIRDAILDLVKNEVGPVAASK